MFKFRCSVYSVKLFAIMSWNEIGKVRTKRSRPRKPYQRDESGSSWLGRVANTVSGLLPGTWIPSWLSEDPPTSSSALPSTVPTSTVRSDILRPSLRTSTPRAIVEDTRHVSFQEADPGTEAGIVRDPRSSSTALLHDLPHWPTAPRSALPHPSSAAPRSPSLRVLSDQHVRPTEALFRGTATLGILPGARSDVDDSPVVSLAANDDTRSQISSRSFLVDSVPVGHASSGSTSQRLFASAAKRARFNPSALNTSLQPLDKSVDCSVDVDAESDSALSRSFCGATPSSPHYSGPTKYGGAASQRITLQHGSRSSYQRRPRATVTRAASAAGSTDGASLSLSSRRILDALQKLSTPLSEARASAASTVRSVPSASVDHDSRSSVYGGMCARLGSGRTPCPPVRRHATLRCAQLLRQVDDVAQRAAVAVEDSEQRRAKHVSFRSDLPATPVVGGKMRRSREQRHYKTSTPLTASDQTDTTPLAGISLGAGTLLKPFDASTPTAATAPVSDFHFSRPEFLPASPVDISAGSSSPISLSQSFKFRRPTSVDAVLMLQPPSSSVSDSLGNRLKDKTSPKYSITNSMNVPVLSDNKSTVVSESRPAPPSVSSVTWAASCAPLTSSLMKAPAGWECQVCLLRNAAEELHCVACQTPKAGVVAPTAVPSSLPKSNSQWECDTCLLQNDACVSKCAACETPRPVKSTNAVLAPTTSPFLSNHSNASQWECDTCLVWNSCQVDKCVACQSLRLASSTKPGVLSATSTFVFGSNKAKASNTMSPSNTGLVFSSKSIGVLDKSQEHSVNNTSSSGIAAFGINSTSCPISSSTAHVPPSEKVTSADCSFTFSSPTKPTSGFMLDATSSATSIVTNLASGTSVVSGTVTTSGPCISSGNILVSSSATTTEMSVLDVHGNASVTVSGKRGHNSISASRSDLPVSVSNAPSSSAGNCCISSFSLPSSNSSTNTKSVTSSSFDISTFSPVKSAPATSTSTSDAQNVGSIVTSGSTPSFVANSSISSSSFTTSLKSTSSILPPVPTVISSDSSHPVISSISSSGSSLASSTPVFTFSAGNSATSSTSQSTTGGFSFSSHTAPSSSALSGGPVVTSTGTAPFVFGQSVNRPTTNVSLPTTSTFSFSSGAVPALQAFGSNSSLVRPSIASSTASTASQSVFTFGAKAPEPPAVFSFGKSAHTSVPSFSVPSNVFTFGAASQSQSSANVQSTSTGQPGFSFQGVNDSATRTGFNFSAAVSTAQPFNFNSAVSATQPFNFGATASPAQPFNFNSSASPAQPFNFNSAASSAQPFNFISAAPTAQPSNFPAANGVQTGVFQFGSVQSSNPLETPTQALNPFDGTGSSIGNRRIKTARRRLKK